jgi:hypothetical protein
MLLKKLSILLFTFISLCGCKEASVEDRYPNLKDLTVNLDTLPTIFEEVANSKKEGAFASFAIGHEKDSINIQFSFEDGQVGIDWVLLGESNIRDKAKYEEYLISKNIQFKQKILNNVSYLRTTEGNLIFICKSILVEMYGVETKDLFDVYYQGIDLQKYVQQTHQT